MQRAGKIKVGCEERSQVQRDPETRHIQAFVLLGRREKSSIRSGGRFMSAPKRFVCPAYRADYPKMVSESEKLLDSFLIS